MKWAPAIVLVLACALIPAAAFAPFELNASLSMPFGLYERSPLGSQPLQRGTLVGACMPAWAVAYRQKISEPLPHGPCPDHTAMVLKYVAAVPGDVVDVTRKGVVVNGRLWSNAPLLTRSKNGSALPMPYLGKTIRVPLGQYWLLTHIRDGFDSRYWGAATTIMYRMRPLLVLRVSR